MELRLMDVSVVSEFTIYLSGNIPVREDKQFPYQTYLARPVLRKKTQFRVFTGILPCQGKEDRPDRGSPGVY